jgi:predicted small secreted protein/predicted esterase
MACMNTCRAVLLTALLLSGCNGMSGPGHGSSSTPARGMLLGTPTLVQVLPTAVLLTQLQSVANQSLLNLSGTPVCDVAVYHFEYETIGGAGESTTASGALMAPTGSNSICTGPRPIVLYAHGTTTEHQFNIANLNDPQNAEGLLLATFFATHGDIVVAPNYAGYDTSALSYHPFLIAAQQSGDMMDALTAARSALPVLSAPTTTDGAKLFITGYSQGGYVAIATERAMQAAGETVTAAAGMSGPYALAAFVDAEFYGEVSAGAPVVGTLLFTGYQHAYGNIYASPGDIFSSPYANDVNTLLPSNLPRSQLYAQGLLPQNAFFSATAPDPTYAAITPPTTPANLAAVFAQGFGAGNLITNAFRLSYLQDAQANPDGGFPTLTSDVPAPSAALPLRAALARNDLRDWLPNKPTLLCGGDQDPEVYFFNTTLLQHYWQLHGSSATPYTVLDLEAPVVSGDPYATLKQGFVSAKAATAATAIAQGATDAGASAVASAYHSTLVPPFCLAATVSLFASH